MDNLVMSEETRKAAKTGQLFALLAYRVAEIQMQNPISDADMEKLILANYKQMEFFQQDMETVLDLLKTSNGFIKIVLDLSLMPLWQSLGKSHFDKILRAGRQIVSFSLLSLFLN